MLMGSTLHVHVQAWKETMEMRAKYDEEERNIDEDLRCATDRWVVLAAFISPLFLILQGSQSKVVARKLGRDLGSLACVHAAYLQRLDIHESGDLRSLQDH